MLWDWSGHNAKVGDSKGQLQTGGVSDILGKSNGGRDEIRVEVLGRFQPLFFQDSNRASKRKQFGFECARAGFCLGGIVRIARPDVVGPGTGSLNALATGLAGLLAASVLMNSQSGASSWPVSRRP